ncbi:hypothetical protein B0A49_04683 [Cryomyces minteri]|uniref:Metallo-beta-lactamase domain-containing protein n=2 Tax=Cryomyces minteri TaxID=331657 RepID=A0A4U0WSF2_9PEZI|nr:hypothetical protein B0A49_04683 [Cryomyces minteri]
MKHLSIDPSKTEAPTRDHPHGQQHPESLPEAKEIKAHPTGAGAGGENASLFFVGTATTILEWEGIRLMTDPNFLHAGDHAHLGPGVTATRVTNPAVDLHDLPRIDVVLLSHYHADHFDQKVEESLRRTLPIITTPHAKGCLQSKGPEESFSEVFDLDFFDSMMVDVVKSDGGDKAPAIKITGMPGKHVPPGVLSIANDLLKAVPPTNGWMVELGYTKRGQGDASFENGYRWVYNFPIPLSLKRHCTKIKAPGSKLFEYGPLANSTSIYISGDTLMIPELKEIPQRYAGQNIDLMLIHLGGTTIPSPSIPLLMVTMDAKQGIELVRLINPDVTIPIHYDDYDAFLSPLSDFKKEIEAAGLTEKVVYLDRKDQYKFSVK